MNIIDDNKHGDEFRLRVLTTNVCNKACSYCLNDFQKKNKAPEYVSVYSADRAVELYVDLCKDKHEEPIITFAGGEPALHPKLSSLLQYAHDKIKWTTSGGTLVVVTNGSACGLVGISIPRSLFESRRVRTRFHIHIPVQDYVIVDENLQTLRGFLNSFGDNVVIQTVAGSHTSVTALRYLGHFCANADIPLKVFSDFYEPTFSPGYLVDVALSGIVGLNLKTRFTGVQTNRGVGCSGCTERCITLKGIWLFPDGSTTICPQGRVLEAPSLPGTTGWFKWAYDSHKVQV